PFPSHHTRAWDAGNNNDTIIAHRSALPILGPFFDPNLLLPTDLADSVLNACTMSFFPPLHSSVNQAKLFRQANHEATTFPPFIDVLLKVTAGPLLQMLPVDTHMLLFPGISANVDEMWAHA